MLSVSIFQFLNRLYKPEKAAKDNVSLLQRQTKEMMSVIHSRQLFDGKEIIDICCGEGERASFYTTLGAVSVVALDPDASNEQSAIARFKARAVENPAEFHFVQSVPEALPYPNNRFDTAFLTDVLSKTSDPASVISEALRVVRPGGFVCIRQAVWDSPHGGDMGSFCRIPYGHLLFSEKTLTAALRDPKDPQSVLRNRELIWIDACNRPHLRARRSRITIGELDRILKKCALPPADYRYLPVCRIMKSFARLPLLHKGVICILQKPERQTDATKRQ